MVVVQGRVDIAHLQHCRMSWLSHMLLLVKYIEEVRFTRWALGTTIRLPLGLPASHTGFESLLQNQHPANCVYCDTTGDSLKIWFRVTVWAAQLSFRLLAQHGPALAVADIHGVKQQMEVFIFSLSFKYINRSILKNIACYRYCEWHWLFKHGNTYIIAKRLTK